MSQQVWKFEIPECDAFNINAPGEIKWLDAQVEHGIPFVWGVVSTDSPPISHVLFLRGTGHPFTGQEGDHIGSFQLDNGALVFHLFEEAQ